jgi:hypothetical protein
MEACIRDDGKHMADLTLAQLEEYWTRIKLRGKSPA